MIAPETRLSYFEQVLGTIWPTSAQIFQKVVGQSDGLVDQLAHQYITFKKGLPIRN